MTPANFPRPRKKPIVGWLLAVAVGVTALGLCPCPGQAVAEEADDAHACCVDPSLPDGPAAPVTPDERDGCPDGDCAHCDDVAAEPSKSAEASTPVSVGSPPSFPLPAASAATERGVPPRSGAGIRGFGLSAGPEASPRPTLLARRTLLRL